MRRTVLIAALAACGDNRPPTGAFEIVGHSDLGARGMNSALAVADTYVYVGSRNDAHGIAIVDVSNPKSPTVINEIDAPLENLAGISSRELRAVPDLNLLFVLNLGCTFDLHGCSPSGASTLENIAIYDIANRTQPFLLSEYPIYGSPRAPRSPHEFFLWRDPATPNHILLYIAEPPSTPSFEILDVSSPNAPSSVAQWDPVTDGGLPGTGGPDNILHSVGASDDGTVAYFSHQTAGLVLVDLSSVIVSPTGVSIRLLTPPANALKWTPGIGPHSAVKVPRRDLLVVTEEIYPMPFGTGCPWGHLRMVDIADPTTPTTIGEFGVPENDASYCASAAPATAFTAHNATATEHLALVTWYAGGLEAIDTADPTRPKQLAELRPPPLPAVEHEDPALGGNPVEMWSYPVIKDGLIYVVDVRNGLYILRYRGAWDTEISERRFLEGNSNLGAYLALHP